MPLGGDQEIPRPRTWRPGTPAAWSPSLIDELSLDLIRSTFVGRVGRPSPVEGAGARESAVLAPFYEEGGELFLLATRRSWALRTHRGEVSFPGGGAEPHDSDLTATALRESAEEVGLDPTSVAVHGELDHLSTVSSDRFIVPFVATLDGPPTNLVPQQSEVDKILHVPVRELLLPGRYREERWGPDHIDYPVHFFEVEGDTIWGATAAMLERFFVLLSGV